MIIYSRHDSFFLVYSHWNPHQPHLKDIIVNDICTIESGGKNVRVWKFAKGNEAGMGTSRVPRCWFLIRGQCNLFSLQYP